MHPAFVSTYRTLPAVLIFALLAGCGSEEPVVSAVTPTPEADTELTAAEAPIDASVFWGPHRYELGTADVPFNAPADYVLTHPSGEQDPIQMPFSIE